MNKIIEMIKSKNKIKKTRKKGENKNVFSSIKNNFVNFIKNKKSVLLICISVVIIITIILIINPKNSKEVSIYRLQFNTNGGGEMNSVEMEHGSKIAQPEDPYKEGFDFLGWYIDGKEVDFESLMLNKNLIIEAKWKAQEGVETVFIYFDTDGGSKLSDIEIMKGNQLNHTLNPIKDGYDFQYWMLNDKRFDFITSITEDITLRAKWEKNSDKNSDFNSFSRSNNNSLNSKAPSSSTSIEKCTYEMKDLKTEYGGSVPEWFVGLDSKVQLYSYYAFWDYNPNGCNITYKVKDSSVVTVNSSGVATGKKIGSTKVDICMVDKSTNKELDCFEMKLDVQYKAGSDRAIKDAKNLVNNISGYYWYLDGYNNAYIKVDKIDWYDYKILQWSSKYIELEGDKFVTTEDTGIPYYSSANIHNKFLVNPIEFAYHLILDYNMRVSSNKLYITLGSKTYTFTKSMSEKTIKGKISAKGTETINKGSYNTFDINRSLDFATYNLSVKSSDESVLSQCSVNNPYYVSCYGKKEGTATLTIIDSVGGTSAQINVTVKTVRVSALSLNKTSMNLQRGNTETLIATISPSGSENKKVTWSSSDTSVATVNNNGRVTAVGKGSATITATTSDGGYTAQCTVNVTNPALNGSVSIEY